MDAVFDNGIAMNTSHVVHVKLSLVLFQISDEEAEVNSLSDKLQSVFNQQFQF